MNTETISLAPATAATTSIIYRSSGDGEFFYVDGISISRNETFLRLKMLCYDFGTLAERAGMPGWGDYYRKWEVPTSHLRAVLPPDIRRELRQ